MSILFSFDYLSAKAVLLNIDNDKYIFIDDKSIICYAEYISLLKHNLLKALLERSLDFNCDV